MAKQKSKLKHSDFATAGWGNKVLKKLGLEDQIITKAYKIPQHIVDRVLREAEEKRGVQTVLKLA